MSKLTIDQQESVKELLRLELLLYIKDASHDQFDAWTERQEQLRIELGLQWPSKLCKETLYAEAYEKWGENAQVMKAIEEFSELNVELAKESNGIRRNGNLFQEIADAEIMLEQLRFIFIGHEKEIDQCKYEKLFKLRTLLQEDA